MATLSADVEHARTLESLEKRVSKLEGYLLQSAMDNPLELDIHLLREDDHPKIADYLLSLSKDQIYDLGIVLGLSHRKLRDMEDSYSRRFLDDVIIAWLRREDQVEKTGNPSWETLVKALRHRRVGQNGIASDIERREIKS